MAYNSVAQVDLELASNSSDSDPSCSPSPALDGHAFRPLPVDTNRLGGGNHLESAKTTESTGAGRLGSMIRSMTSTSYDLVEDDDYDADPSRAERSHRLSCMPALDTSVPQHSSSPEPPLHSASSDLPVPLSCPIPDLQSRQGAYIGNVARLEQSAEQMSSSSADIGSEIRKMDQEQKRRSCSSASNSVISRNGRFSPARTISSAHGSIPSAARQSSASGPRLPDVSEPAHGEDENVFDRISAALPGILPPKHPAHPTSDKFGYDQYGPEWHPREIDRPSTAASNDTYQQARTLFTGFDGIHFTPVDRDSARRLPLNKPPLASKPEPYKDGQTGEQMVYYPAPVPRMLNLPPKLSRKAIADREKRRTQLLDSIPAENRKSAPWLAESDRQQPNDHQDQKRQAALPSQLRASVSFEQPSASLDVEVKQDSAVAMLDSILDASAHAPVSAFTDHPFAGHIGSYVYGKARRKMLAQDKRAAPKSTGLRQTTTGDVERESEIHCHDESRRPGNDHDEDYEDSDEHERSQEDDSEGAEHSPDDEDEEDEEYDYVGPPNTLLAELELRKQEQKQRRRTALPLPSQAVHATLLELDEMAQKQSEKRRRRPVTLAWEGRDTVDDDDVPLAMLYPDKTNPDEEDRPAGLMGMRQLEDTEPLSSRRARLRGEPILDPQKRPTTMYATDVPEPPAESEDEGETLAERLRRLKGQNPAESEFASELLAELNTRVGSAAKDGGEANDDETLAQRRSRLQKEGLAQRDDTKNLRMRRSMAARPQGPPPPVARKSSHSTLLQQPGLMGQEPEYGNRSSMQQFPPHMGCPIPSAYQTAQPYGYGMGYQNPYFYSNNATMGMNRIGYVTPNGCGPNMARRVIDPVQRDVIDRWRQSIR